MRRADIEVPNLPVAVNAWGRSACYPRSTFYLMSYGPSTQDRRVTIPDFRPCSTYRSHSQAPFYYCALRTIADRAEGTLGLLRYSLGGDHPSQTTQLALSPARLHGTRLEFLRRKSGISLTTPDELAPTLHSLPPMLHSLRKNPILAYSKGSRGLSVLLRVKWYLHHCSNFAESAVETAPR